MKAILLALVVALASQDASGNMCVSGNQPCSPGTGTCNTAAGETCMQIVVGAAGTIQSLCSGPLAENCFCDPTLTSVEACLPGLSCQSNKKFFQCLPSEPIGPTCESSDRSWQLVYSHDAYGGALDGTDVDDLVDAVRNGAEIKVLLEPGSYYENLDIQKVSVSFDDDLQLPSVHGQNLHFFQAFPNMGYNLYSIFSSNGNAHYSQFFINDPENKVRINSNVPTAMKWYARRASGQVNSLTRLSRAIQDGANVRVEDNDSFRHLYAADLSTEDLIQGLTYEMRDKMDKEQFNTTEQWVFSHWESDGDVQQSYWLVNKAEGTEYKQLTGETINYFVDACWEFVYRHNGLGEALSGTLDNLLDNINAGKKIKVRIGSKYHEVRVIKINEGQVTAQVFDNWDDDVEIATWKWLEVSTTGTVKTVVLLVGGSIIISDDTAQMEVTWFAEKRDWSQIDVSELPSAIQNGGEFRFRVTLDDELVWYQTDSVFNVFGLMSEREFVFYDNKYHRRYALGNYMKLVFMADYVYMDYPLGDMAQSRFQLVSTPITYFISQ